MGEGGQQAEGQQRDVGIEPRRSGQAEAGQQFHYCSMRRTPPQTRRFVVIGSESASWPLTSQSSPDVGQQPVTDLPGIRVVAVEFGAQELLLVDYAHGEYRYTRDHEQQSPVRAESRR